MTEVVQRTLALRQTASAFPAPAGELIWTVRILSVVETRTLGLIIQSSYRNLSSMHNALTDLSWVRTSEGNYTAKDALIRADELDGLNLDVPALEASSTLRLLCQVFALTVREMGGVSVLRRSGRLDPDAVERAIEAIGPAADLFDSEQPFMQRPALPPMSPKDATRRLGAGDQPVKKLFPFMPSDQAEDFWGLSHASSNSLSLEEATRALVVFHHFSMAGNNRYDGDKCQMGAPGIRFPGQENTATEIVWQGANLLETLSFNTPRSWVEKGGLPAWADRTGIKSRNEDASGFTPLWEGSWSSNTAVGYWEDEALAGVRTGGVPPGWLPLKGADQKALKQWWDNRNTRDPFYLYIPDKSGEKKAQRLDLQRDSLDLAVEWNVDSKAQYLMEGAQQNVANPRAASLIFFRHQIGGTASSPSIRASETLIGDSEVWAPDQEVADSVREFSELIRKLHFVVAGSFRRNRNSDQGAGGVTVLDGLESRRQDASAFFWREMNDAFLGYIAHAREDPSLTKDDVIAIRRACLAAFDQAAAPYRNQHFHAVEQVRARVEGIVNSLTKIAETED